MEALIPAVFTVGFILLAIQGARMERHRRDEVFRGTAERLGVNWHPAGSPFMGKSAGLSGTLDGFRLSTEQFTRDEQTGVRVTLDGVGHPRGRIPPTLELEREGASLNLLQGEDVVVGEPTFDELVRVRGHERSVHAVLGPEARRAVLAAIEAGPGFKVAGGAVLAHFLPVPSADDLAEGVRRAAKVASSLLLPAGGQLEALARRADADPAPGVRLRAFDTLAAQADAVEVARATARRLLDDPHPEVRLKAASALGEEGFETLAGLVRSAAPPLDQRADNGRLWWEIDLGEGRRYALAEELDRSPEGHARRQARALARLAGRFPAARVLPLMREALEQGAAPLRIAALAAVAKIGDASFEEAAVAALDSPAAEIRAAAVEALGAVGTAAAVPPLRALAGRAGAFEFSVRRAVDGAVAAIQARLSGAAAGQISLAGDGEDAAGRVSLAGGPGDGGGRVSLAP